MKRLTVYVGLFLILVGVIVALFTDVRGNSTASAKPLADIESIDDLRGRFNKGIGQPRLVLLVSPT